MTDGARSRQPSVCVVGGGITGLTLAYSLVRARRDLRVVLIESRDRLGGNIATERFEGFLVDAGPDSFLRTKPDAAALCKELGLEDELVTTRPEARRVYLVHDGRLEPMPGGMALAVPTRIGPMVRTPILSWRGKLRVAREPFVRRRDDDGDESIAEFVARRMGREAADRIAGPLLGGIYAGDVGRLSVRSTFPQLVEMEKKHGSLVRGLFAASGAARGDVASRGTAGLLSWLARAAQVAPSPFLSLRGGMDMLVDRLIDCLPPDAVRLDRPVTQVAQVPGYDGRWLVETAAGEPFVADAVALTLPAYAAARAVPDDALAGELRRIPYVSTATVFLGFDREAVSHPLDGVGFIAPHSESRILAGTWVSTKWAARAPAGRVLMRAFVGGARSPHEVERSDDDELVRLVKTELTRLMGSMGEPLFTRVFRYVKSNPQPVVGHEARLRRIRTRLASLPGLYVAGAAYDGVGIPDCVRQARVTAAEILECLAVKEHGPAAALAPPSAPI